MPQEPGRGRLPAGTAIGRVRLRVRDLDTVLPTYRDAVGLEVDREPGVARLSADGESLVELEESGDLPDRGNRAGLFHLAIRVPDRPTLGRVLERLRDRDLLEGASDHRVSEALYLHDPEGNGIEVYRDRPRSTWPRTPDGGVGITTEPLDLDGVAGASATAERRLPAGTTIGHVHLEATGLSRSEAFYADGIGFDVQARYGDSAVFLGAGGYHHHVGVNTWNRRRSPAGDSLGVVGFEVVVPSPTDVDDVLDRVDPAAHPAGVDPAGRLVDPDGIEVRITTPGG